MNWTYGLIGALIGISIAVFANRVLLPYVLKQQAKELSGQSYSIAPRSWLASAYSWTPLIYQGMYLFLPVVFGTVGLTTGES